MEMTPLPWSKLGEHFINEDKAQSTWSSFGGATLGRLPTLWRRGPVPPNTEGRQQDPQGRPEVPRVPEAVHGDGWYRVQGFAHQSDEVDPRPSTYWRFEEGHLGSPTAPDAGGDLPAAGSWSIASATREPGTDGDQAEGQRGSGRGYIGGKRKGGRGRRPADGGRKAAVAVLVERDGNVRAMPMARIDGDSMEREIRNYVEAGSRLMTDETNIYSSIRVKGQQRSLTWSARRSTTAPASLCAAMFTRTRRKASFRC